MIKTKVKFIKVFNVIFPLIIKTCPLYFVVYCICDITQGVSYGINTYFMQQFFDSVSSSQESPQTFTNTLFLAGIVAFIMIALQVLNGVSNFLYNNLIKKLNGHMNHLLNEKAYNLDPIVFENPDTLDDINKAQEGAKNSVGMVFSFLSIFTFHLPYFLYMLFYLYQIRPIFSIILVFMILPMSISQVVKGRIFFKQEDKAAPLRRKCEYYENAICDIDYYKETRMLGAFEYFYKFFNKTVLKLNKAILDSERKSMKIELAIRLVSVVGYLMLLISLVQSTIVGYVSIGTFAAVFSSIGLVFSVMEAIIVRNLGVVSHNIAQSQNFISFLNLPEIQGVKKNLDYNKGIELKNVSFQYPGSTHYALDNINLKIAPNETIAIVGENGAGKSTLVKLIAGIYKPTSGDVYIGGENTSKIHLVSITREMSAAFQNFQKYKMSLFDNVAISDFSKEPEDVKDVLSCMNISANSPIFPDGIGTILATEFDGVDISGGLWQRVAISRALYKKSAIIFLDEPTSSIDPIEETKLYQQFANLSQNKLAFIITHRLGSARIADRILVMDNGRIIENGTHEDLIYAKGKYATMFQLQANWYMDKNAQITEGDKVETL